VRNLQGDVVQIRSIYGTAVVEYTYDAWGNVLSITGQYANTLGELNPIRYRGYFYDFETGFYYLQSRYYDPVIRRFISADDPELLGASGTFLGYNLYAYCENNPVNNVDENGTISLKQSLEIIKSIGLKFLGSIISLAKNIIKAFIQPGRINLKPFEIVIDAIISVLVPGLSSAVKMISYKAFNRELVKVAFKNASKGIITTLSKFGIQIGANILLGAILNEVIFKYTTRFLTIGGIICLALDCSDGIVDYWFDYKKVYINVKGLLCQN